MTRIGEIADFTFQFHSPLAGTTQHLRLAVLNQLPGDRIRVRLNHTELTIRLERSEETVRRAQPIPGGIWQTTAEALPLKPGENHLRLEVIARDNFPCPIEVGEFEIRIKPKN